MWIEAIRNLVRRLTTSTGHTTVVGDRTPRGCDTCVIWPSFDPQLRRDLDNIREMAARRHQTPAREWAVIFVAQYGEMLVVREWPDGSLTAYSTSEYSNDIRGTRK